MLRNRSCLHGIDIAEKAIGVSEDRGMGMPHFGKTKERQLLPG